MKICIITGPRVLNAGDEKLIEQVVGVIGSRGFKFYVGDARGTDLVARKHAIIIGSDVNVFSPLPELSRTPAGLAERSTRMVKEAIAASWGNFHTQDKIICVGFPNRACPTKIVPARSWKSDGSGTWSTIALAIGHGIETFAFPLVGIGFSIMPTRGGWIGGNLK